MQVALPLESVGHTVLQLPQVAGLLTNFEQAFCEVQQQPASFTQAVLLKAVHSRVATRAQSKHGKRGRKTKLT
jgi:hypothetical protein